MLFGGKFCIIANFQAILLTVGLKILNFDEDDFCKIYIFGKGEFRISCMTRGTRL